MRRFAMSAAVLVMMWAGTVGYAQGLKNEDDFDKWMKAIGAAFGAANKAMQSGSMADAKAEVTKAKAYLGAVEAFKEADGTCGACHANYREQNPETKAYSIKAGTL